MNRIDRRRENALAAAIYCLLIGAGGIAVVDHAIGAPAARYATLPAYPPGMPGVAFRLP